MKKFFMLLVAILCTIATFAEPQLIIGSYDHNPVGLTQFAKPSVIVMDGRTNVTGQYDITYMIYGQSDSSGDTYDAAGTAGTDSRGIDIYTDSHSGNTYVEKIYGNVSLGTGGKVKIAITATPKSTSVYKTTISDNFYTLDIHEVTTTSAEMDFAPEFPMVGDVATLTMGTLKSEIGDYDSYYLSAAYTPAPEVDVYTTVGEKRINITDYYDIAITYSDNDQTDAGLITFENNIIKYLGKGNQWAGFPSADIDAITAKFPGYTGKLTYTLTPKTGYESYGTLTKIVDVKITNHGGKQNLQLYLPKTYFTADNVTGTEYDKDTPNSGYIMHVTKYSHEYGKYQYNTPNPAILTEGGMQLPVNGGSRNTGGGWGDFLLYYEIESQYNYADSCQWDPLSGSGTIVAKGANSTDSGYNPIGSISPVYMQTNFPGLAKVKVWAVLDSSAKVELKNNFAPYEGTDKPKSSSVKAYTEPICFYVDVMKRVPELIVSPDPSTVQFAANQHINWTEDFDVSGYRGTTENSYEGWLIWGSSDQAAIVDGKEVDHFAYTFFISDRDQTKIQVIDWPKEVNGDEKLETEGRDTYRFQDYQTIVSQSAHKGHDIMVGDKIYIGIGETGADEEGYVVVDDSNLATYQASHPTLQIGDKIHGISYFSGKGYGNFDNAHWFMQFNSDQDTEDFQIGYTIRPWNHVRWDIGSSDQGTTFYTFHVSKTVNTKIDLSYYFTTATKNQNPFDEPTARVISPDNSNKDVTEHFPLKYMIDGAAAMSETEKSEAGITGDGNYYKDATTGTIIKESDGSVVVGGTIGTVRIKVWTDSGIWEDEANNIKYNAPEPTYYSIRIVESLAKWEIISSCKVNAELEITNCTPWTGEGTARWEGVDGAFEEHTDPLGRFHILTAGDLYGGTTITGVPGIKMTIGTDADAASQADWASVAGASTLHCCSHETTNAVIEGLSNVQLDQKDIPTAGTFYKFEPSTNGFLTFDGRLTQNHNLVLIDATTLIKQEKKWTDADHLGDILFEKPLLAGHVYYLYDLNGKLRMHGFAYQPAYIMDANTTKDESEAPIQGRMFMSGVATDVPTLVNGNNSAVTFSTTSPEYVTPNADGTLTPLKMTIDNRGNINSVRIQANVASADAATLGNCISKNTVFDVKIIDIPTYAVCADNTDSYGRPCPTGGEKVTTTNIATAITMTWGKWADTDNNYDGSKQDQWDYKSGNGAAERIGNETGIGNDETWNKTIDGFKYFSAAKNNPVDERNMNPQTHTSQKYTTVNNGSYNFKSGSQFEYKQNHDYRQGYDPENIQVVGTDYNTTYRLPARGAVLKFEPEESGIVLLYLVQNGSVDYFPGKEFKDTDKPHQVKWRPLYITDETGKIVDVVDDFSTTHLEDYLPSGTTNVPQPGSVTWGLSRCDKDDASVAAMWSGGNAALADNGCSFDWSEFRGTKKGELINGVAIPVGESDQERLLEAWTAKGEREGIIRLANGGFALPHKAYVRYTFSVKAGKTYFVFQPGSKFEFGGFSFVPKGYPTTCKYTVDSHPARTDATENLVQNTGYSSNDLTFKWDNGDIRTNAGTPQFTELKENIGFTIDDQKYSSTAAHKDRNFETNKWQSICLPFSVNETQCTELFGAGYVLLTCDGAYNATKDGQDYSNVLHFVRHANRYIEAGRPYLLLPQKDGKFSFSNVTIEGDKMLTAEQAGEETKLINPKRFDVAVTADGYGTGNAFTFKGTYCRAKVKAGSLVVAANGLGYYSTDKEIGGYRAFFEIGESSSAKAVNFVDYELLDFVEGDASLFPTGIICIDEDANGEQSFELIPGNSAVYDVNGAKLSDDLSAFKNAASGVYVINGKKYVK